MNKNELLNSFLPTWRWIIKNHGKEKYLIIFQIIESDLSYVRNYFKSLYMTYGLSQVQENHIPLQNFVSTILCLYLY